LPRVASEVDGGIQTQNLSELAERAYHQVFLYLLVELIQAFLLLVNQDVGLMVAPSPVVHVLLVQVLVGQHQRAETVARVLLYTDKEEPRCRLMMGALGLGMAVHR